MRNTGKGYRRAVVLIGLLILVSASACSRKSPAPPLSPPPPDPAMRIVMIGNSEQLAGIDFQMMESVLGCKVENRARNAMQSAWEFATLWHAIHDSTPPSMIVVNTEWYFIMKPDWRIQGEFTAAIDEAVGNDARLRVLLDSVCALGPLVADAWDFWSSLPYSFLPLMVQEASKANVTLVLARYRNCYYVRDPLYMGDVENGFRDAMARYCTDNGVVFLDFTQNPRIMIEHFMDDWHLNSLGQTLWTGLFAEDINSILAGKRPADLVQGAFPLPAVSFSGPDTAGERDTAIFYLNPGQPALWSCLDSAQPPGERFLCSGETLRYDVPAGYTPERNVGIFADVYGVKYPAVMLVRRGIQRNLPPLVDAGPDRIVLANQPCTLSGAFSDDSLSPLRPPRIHWQFDNTGATLSDSTVLGPILVFSDPGTVLLRLTVNDGEYVRFDQIQVVCSASDEIRVIEPVLGQEAYAGDTMLIRWTATPGVTDAVLDYSYDAGRTFIRMEQMFTSSDSSWGRFLWTVPSDAPRTNEAVIRISNYQATTVGYSSTFAIYP